MCVVAINETIPSNYQKVSKKPHKKKQPQKQKMLLKPYYLPKIVSGAFHMFSFNAHKNSPLANIINFIHLKSEKTDSQVLNVSNSTL